MEIPREKVGLVIGRKGRRLKEIQEQTGVQVFIKDNQAHLRGTSAQRQKARKIIEDILNPNVHEEHGKSSSNRGGFKMLRNLMVPEHLMGHVIGKGRENLNTIETKAGVSLKVIDNKLHIKGATEKQQKLAVREIKALANLGIKRSHLAAPFTKFVYIDTAQLEEDHELQLSIAQQQITNASSGENYYKLKLLEHPLQEETSSGFTNTDSLRDTILGVLKRIHREKGEEEVRVDMWCHFGHAYITKVDEDELEETFTLKEIKEKIEIADSKSWKPFFKEGVEELEVEAIEKYLPSSATTEDIRHDFTFYTPSCRDVRVKAWLIKEDAPEESEAAAPMAFSRTAPIPVKNVLTRVQSDERGETSNTPCFHICSQFHSRMKVDILIPSKGLDCRLSIRTCKNYVPKTPEDDEEDKILESYLMGMKIDEGRLTLPPASELQDGFDLFYQRRSLRKTYQYEMDGEQFSLTVCKDQATNVDPCDPDANNVDGILAKMDIHLHCDEWDRVLDEGNWEPEEIVAKLPAFLRFLREVQKNVSPKSNA